MTPHAAGDPARRLTQSDTSITAVAKAQLLVCYEPICFLASLRTVNAVFFTTAASDANTLLESPLLLLLPSLYPNQVLNVPRTPTMVDHGPKEETKRRIMAPLLYTATLGQTSTSRQTPKKANNSETPRKGNVGRLSNTSKSALAQSKKENLISTLLRRSRNGDPRWCRLLMALKCHMVTLRECEPCFLANYANLSEGMVFEKVARAGSVKAV